MALLSRVGTPFYHKYFKVRPLICLALETNQVDVYTKHSIKYTTDNNIKMSGWEIGEHYKHFLTSCCNQQKSYDCCLVIGDFG